MKPVTIPMNSSASTKNSRPSSPTYATNSRTFFKKRLIAVANMCGWTTSGFDFWISAATDKANGNRRFQYGISKVRELILQLAVSGRLASQDIEDEKVEVLLQRTDHRRSETAQRDKRADPFPQPILSAEDRWAIPGTWVWRGLADLALFVDYRGNTPKKQ